MTTSRPGGDHFWPKPGWPEESTWLRNNSNLSSEPQALRAICLLDIYLWVTLRHVHRTNLSIPILPLVFLLSVNISTIQPVAQARNLGFILRVLILLRSLHLIPHKVLYVFYLKTKKHISSPVPRVWREGCLGIVDVITNSVQGSVKALKSKLFSPISENKT